MQLDQSFASDLPVVFLSMDDRNRPKSAVVSASGNSEISVAGSILRWRQQILSIEQMSGLLWLYPSRSFVVWAGDASELRE